MIAPDFSRPISERWRIINTDLNAELHRQGRAGYGWLSVNRYKAVCMNLNRVFFGDVDSREDPQFKKKIPRFYSEEQALQMAEQVAAKRKLIFRIYRTYAGIRLIELSKLHDPYSLEAQETMDELGCDLSFIKLTRKQGVFRCRLTPKPWRAEPRTVNFQWRDVDILEYLKNPRWRIADYIRTIGGSDDVENINPEIAFVVSLHDTYCCGDESRPLA